MMDVITAGVLTVAIVVPITVVGLVALGHKEALSKLVDRLLGA